MDNGILRKNNEIADVWLIFPCRFYKNAKICLLVHLKTDNLLKIFTTVQLRF